MTHSSYSHTYINTFITSSWPVDGLEQLSYCPVCGSPRTKILHSNLKDLTFYSTPDEWKLHHCLNCSSAFLNPRPTQNTIHKAYSNYFTHNDSNSTTNNIPLGKIRLIRRKLANGYRNFRFGSNFKPSYNIGRFIIPLLLNQCKKLKSELRYIPRLKPGAKLLDIGAGNGNFLFKAREVGWQVFGSEPDPDALAIAKNADLNIRHGGIESFSNDPPESFDAITINHVIEHVHNPQYLLTIAYSLLKPGGFLYIETPNILSYGHKRYGQNWRGLEPPRHLVLFNWNSLEWLLKTVGFKRIKHFPHNEVYPGIAAASVAIEKNLGLDSNIEATIKDSLINFLTKIQTKLHYKKSEFITLIAFKPN